MTSTFLQGTTTAPAPPIPAMPARAGGATGGQPAAPVIAGPEGAPAGQPAPAPAQGPGIPTTQPPDIPFDPNLLVRESIPIVGMSLAMVIVIFIGLPLTLAFTRRLGKRELAGVVQAKDLQPQLRQLQESVDAMAIEIERISEAQRFQAKLMAERPAALPEGERRG